MSSRTTFHTFPILAVTLQIKHTFLVSSNSGAARARFRRAPLNDRPPGNTAIRFLWQSMPNDHWQGTDNSLFFLSFFSCFFSLFSLFLVCFRSVVSFFSFSRRNDKDLMGGFWNGHGSRRTRTFRTYCYVS